MPSRRRIIIVGGGCSGTLLAIHLAARGQPVVLIERGRPARGVAYSTSERRHLLNVPVGRMSAFSDDPDHFFRWLRSRAPEVERSSFVPRADFGAYLEDTLAAHRDRIDVILGEAVDIERKEHVATVLLADGRRIDGEIVALALGNPAPSAPCPMDASVRNDPRYIGDPWNIGALDAASWSKDTPIVLIGTGLTMIDVTLTLKARDPMLQCIAVSRRGLLPTEHRPASVPPDYSQALDMDRWPATALGMLRSVRRAIEESNVDWRETINLLRPLTPSLWSRLPLREKSRFARRLRVFWDVHRHRMAPVIAEHVRTSIASGTLTIRRGQITAIHATPTSMVVGVRGPAGDFTIDAAYVVNCTGPDTNLVRASALLTRLAQRGLVRSDALTWGIDADDAWCAIDRVGQVQPWLMSFGPLLRGLLWETTAVPELRAQAEKLASRIA